jgi:hypothetical protein
MIAVWPIDPPLPVIGLSGVLVIAQMVIKAIVPAIFYIIPYSSPISHSRHCPKHLG